MASQHPYRDQIDDGHGRPDDQTHGGVITSYSIHYTKLYERKAVTESASNITARLGKEGYAFANVNTIPDVNQAKKTVSLTFFVDPGKRVYVRRINMTGNTKTQDEVLRREMRQMEAAWIRNNFV